MIHTMTEIRTDNGRFEPGRFTIKCTCGWHVTGCYGPGHAAGGCGSREARK